MTLNLDAYRVQIPYIKLWLDNKIDWKYMEEVGPIALATQCHIVAVSHYIGELYGFSDEINDKIARDMKFYNVLQIAGKKESI